MKKLKLMTIIGTRPEIIRLSEVIKKCDKYFAELKREVEERSLKLKEGYYQSYEDK